MGKPRRLLPLLLIVAAVAATDGCGSGEREFDAESVVAELNAGGAGLELGAALASDQGEKEIHALLLDGGGSGPGDEMPAGAVVIAENPESAEDEFSRCESAVSFICFRAANAVFRFSNISLEQEARITAALRSLQSED